MQDSAPLTNATEQPPSAIERQHFQIHGDGLHSGLDLLAQKTGLNKQDLKRYAIQGAIWLTRSQNAKPVRLRRLKKPLTQKQRLDFYYQPGLLNTEPPPATLIDDLNAYSVWLKPRGMLSQGSKWADHTALYRWVEQHYQPDGQSRQCWIVHRLDRATQGLMLLAHNKTTARQLTQQFEHRQTHKTYLALVWGQFPNQPQTITQPLDGKNAISHIQLLDTTGSDPISRVQIDIETGRKHQIRRHLAGLGFPVVGDRLYGDTQRDSQLMAYPDLQLTAYKLGFTCPLTQQPRQYQLTPDQLGLIEP